MATEVERSIVIDLEAVFAQIVNAEKQLAGNDELKSEEESKV